MVLYARGDPGKIKELRIHAERLGLEIVLYSDLQLHNNVVLDAAGSDGKIYRDPQITIDFPSHTVYVRGSVRNIPPTQFRLLQFLVNNPGMVLSHDRLLREIWKSDRVTDIENVRYQIHALRKNIEEDPKNPRLVETVTGFGYRYNRPDSPTYRYNLT